jgi:hypothetical protein
MDRKDEDISKARKPDFDPTPNNDNAVKDAAEDASKSDPKQS